MAQVKEKYLFAGVCSEPSMLKVLIIVKKSILVLLLKLKRLP